MRESKGGRKVKKVRGGEVCAKLAGLKVTREERYKSSDPDGRFGIALSATEKKNQNETPNVYTLALVDNV